MVLSTVLTAWGRSNVRRVIDNYLGWQLNIGKILGNKNAVSYLLPEDYKLVALSNIFQHSYIFFLNLKQTAYVRYASMFQW